MPKATHTEIIKTIIENLSLLNKIATNGELSPNARRRLGKDIAELQQQLNDLLVSVDLIRQPDSVFDPSEPKVVGRFVALAMVAQTRQALASLDKFYGAGVYAIYYTGDLPTYERIKNTETPIYVGKADPEVGNARTPMEQGTRLTNRLNDHKKNINKANNLDIHDFEYRSLVVQSGWQTAAESYLIHLFKPIWNKETKIIYGLGKHGDSASTRSNKRSPWDTLHPAREWAADASLVDAKTPEDIDKELDAHFQATKVYQHLEDVLEEFISELSQIS